MAKNTIAQLKVSLEIHLPELVGLLHLKPLYGSMFFTLRGLDLVMAMQDGSDRTGSREDLHPFLFQLPADFASTPARMLASHPQDSFFQRWTTFVRTVLGTPTALIQPWLSLLFIPLEPLVACSRCNSIFSAQSSDIRIFPQCFFYKFCSLRHDTALFPRHIDLQLDNMPILQIVYMMSPNRCLLSPQSIQIILNFIAYLGEG